MAYINGDGSEKDFGYSPDGWGRKRDKAWPSEIAAQRPALVTRIQCNDPYEIRDSANTIRGEREPGSQSSHDLFNERLRGGHRLIVSGDGE